jgi:hypothetical protein
MDNGAQCVRERGRNDFSAGLWGSGIIADEVLEFQLALADRSVFDLPPGVHRWVDIVYVDDFGQQDVKMRFGLLHDSPARMSLLGFGGIGRYSVIAMATSETPHTGKGESVGVGTVRWRDCA